MEQRRLSKPKILYIIIAVLVVALIAYANGVAFNLITLPSSMNNIVAYSALGVAVTLTLVIIGFVIRNVRLQGFDAWKKNLPDIGSPVKFDRTVSPKTPSSTSSISAKTQAIKVQKSEEKIEIEMSEDDNQLFKPMKASPSKLICPACRKEFEMPAYLGELMVDFGPRKSSNLIRECRHCGTIIALKQAGASDEVWK